MCGSTDVAMGKKTKIDAEDIHLLPIICSHASGPINSVLSLPIVHWPLQCILHPHLITKGAFALMLVDVNFSVRHRTRVA